jgi:hypothetical protein
MHHDEIDVINSRAYITPERIHTFQYTNAFTADSLVAIYVQQRNDTKFIDFNGVAAGVSANVYVFTIAICCLLVILFVYIDYVRPSSNFNFFYTAMAILPCFNGQVPHSELSSPCPHCLSVG